MDGKLGTESLNTGQIVTVSCAEGDVANIYDGIVLYDVEKTNLRDLPKTKTSIMMNVGSPDQAFKFSSIPNAGVGLAREEFIINNLKESYDVDQATNYDLSKAQAAGFDIMKFNKMTAENKARIL